ncbi:MAG: hypothetical protein ACK449_17265 [Planctomycetota bacterium]|jgi:hypothetical protein
MKASILEVLSLVQRLDPSVRASKKEVLINKFGSVLDSSPGGLEAFLILMSGKDPEDLPDADEVAKAMCRIVRSNWKEQAKFNATSKRRDKTVNALGPRIRGVRLRPINRGLSQ